MLKTLTVGIVLTCVAVPVAAQKAYGPPPPASRLPGISVDADRVAVERDVNDARRQIRRGRDSGTLSRREARGLRREANQIGTLADRYGEDGLSDAENAELANRARVLRDVTNGQRIRSPAPKR